MTVNAASLLIALGFVLLVGLALSLRRVPQGQAWTVERFGRYTRTLAPGLGWVLPVAERIRDRHDLRERSVVVPPQEILTQDRIRVMVGAVCFCQIVDPARASYEVQDSDMALRELLAAAVRNQLSDFDLDALLGRRSRLGAALLEAIEESAGAWGLHLIRVELRDLSPPEDLMAAITGERTKELERRAAVLTAEGERRARRLRAETERDGTMMEAETRARVATLDAESRERRAEAEARASLMLSRALEQGSPKALDYLIAQQYVDALKTLAASDNGRFVVLPLENGHVTASLEGIHDLAATAWSVWPQRDVSPGEPERQAEPEPVTPPAAVHPFQPPDVDGRTG